MSAKLRRSLKPALLTLAVASVAAAFGFAGTQAPAAAGVALTAGTAPADRLAPAVRAEPSPGATTGPPPTEPSPCPVSVLGLVKADPCLIVGSLQELGAYGLEDAARDLGGERSEGREPGQRLHAPGAPDTGAARLDHQRLPDLRRVSEGCRT